MVTLRDGTRKVAALRALKGQPRGEREIHPQDTEIVRRIFPSSSTASLRKQSRAR
jgi:hypothetical protein